MSGWPAPPREEAPQVADERASLEAWLEFHRATLLTKCAGLEPEQLATRSSPPSTLSLLGLVRHLTEVEAWFHDFDGENRKAFGIRPTPIPTRASTPSILAGPTPIWLRTRQRRSGPGGCRRASLDDISPALDDGRPVSLRWVYLHMIEEYARHNGHADLLRERIDGVTGE